MSDSLSMQQEKPKRPDVSHAPSRSPDFKGADLRNAQAQGAVFDGGRFELASFKGAHFTNVDFGGAVFDRCDFAGANLAGHTLQGKHVTIQGLRHLVIITRTHMFIGCMHHTHDEWRAMPMDTILARDDGGEDEWRLWKDTLLSVCDTLANSVF